ncbi:hypothetical protein GCU54_16445 [Geodermatophilus normandii]|uniref:DUF6817 domain-containing protein n=1 Tax=Geodermatophilus normandii TaxID=1137989 RepID=A0A6P0GK06_9ACTN|nr:hypothetical protein [Geodermatophilus normandii]
MLRARGADTIDHPGGTLGAHLERVQRRLAGLGAPPVLQLAGRAHAVYGTDGFDVALLTLAERPLLTGIVGPDAERVVYRYGACERARTWSTLADDGRVWDRFTGEVSEPAPDELRAFADLSLVNELDVAEHSPGFLDRYGDLLRRLAGSWEPLLSPAVVADARQVLGA